MTPHRLFCGSALVVCSVLGSTLLVKPTDIVRAQGEIPVLSGTAPPVVDSEALLALNGDLANSHTFRWHSSDSVLGIIDVSGDEASTWTYFPATAVSPARLVFTATVDGVTLSGNVLFENYWRGVVDVTRASARVRYLLTAACPCLLCQLPAAPDGVVAPRDEKPHLKVPLGGAVAMTAPACFKVFVPTKLGGKLKIATTAGAISELKYPDGTAFVNGSDTGQNKHGWYTFKISGSNEYTVSNTFIQEGEAKTIPWNFWYFPYKPRDAGAAGGPRLFDNPGAYSKYDTAFGLAGKESALKWENNRHNKPKAEGWAGHCWGVSLASIILQQPAGDGTFVADELEGLGGEFFDAYTATPLSGYANVPFEKPTAAVTDAVDRFVHRFHSGVTEMLRVEKTPLHMNLRQSDEVDAESVITYNGQPGDASGIRVIAATTELFEFDDDGRLGRGTIPVAIGADDDATYHNLATAISQKFPTLQVAHDPANVAATGVHGKVTITGTGLVTPQRAANVSVDDNAEVWNQGCYKYEVEMREDPAAAGDPHTEQILQILHKMTFVCNDDFVQPNEPAGVSTGDPSDVTLRRQQETEYMLIYGADGTVQPNGSLKGRKQNWLTMKVTREALEGAVNKNVFVPEMMTDVRRTAGAFKNDKTASGSNPEVTGARLTTLGLKKNNGF
jgi:hypothetical protein